MNGIVAGAMSGLGEGLSRGSQMAYEHWSRDTLATKAAEVQKLRDDRLEELRRKPGMEAAKEIEAANAKPAYDAGADSVRPRTPEEKAAIEEGAYRKQGMIQEAMSVRTTDQQRQRDLVSRTDKEADNRRADLQLTETIRHQGAVEKLQRGQFDELKKTGEMDRAIKQVTLDNTKRVDDLRKEFTTATPERKKAITEEAQLLTGKDNDNYLPVPLKDDMGNVTGYKVFDKKRGVWVEDNAGGAQPNEAHIEALRKRSTDPLAITAFDAQFGKGSAAKFLNAPAQQKPKAAPANAASPRSPSFAEAMDKYSPPRRREPRDLQEEDRMLVP